MAIVCTHGHNDHVNAAADLADRYDGAPILVHPDDRMLWDVVYPTRPPDREIPDGDVVEVAGVVLTVRHTPGPLPRRHLPDRRAGSAGRRHHPGVRR